MRRNLCAVGLVCLLAGLASAVYAERVPVILVPGLAGSVLEEKLNRTNTSAFYCSKETDWRVVWLSLTTASRPDCLLDELDVFYNTTDKRYYNQTGVEIRAYQFGNLTGIAALDPALPTVSGTYQKMIAGLMDIGYQEGKDLFGAPYDFRLAADGLEQVGFFNALKGLIEEAVAKNDNSPAAIVAHSMGCLVTIYFLTKQSPEWRRQHISLLVSMSAPLEGAVTALKGGSTTVKHVAGSISGDNFDVSFIPSGLLRPLQSRVPSGPWLFPNPDVWGDTVLVQTKGGDNYTARDALKLLQDLNLTQQAAVYPRVHSLTFPLPKLDMPVHCLYGVGVKTEMGFQYDLDHFNATVIPPAPSNTTAGDGDGTVNLRSLESCSRLGDAVTLQSFENATHLGLLQDERTIKVVLSILGDHGKEPKLFNAVYSTMNQFYRSIVGLSLPRRQLTDRKDAHTLRHPQNTKTRD